MQLIFLAWFFFNLCGLALSNEENNADVTSQHQTQDFKHSKPVLQAQVHGLDDTLELLGEYESRGSYSNESEHGFLHSIKKGQKGKGASGGSNTVHHPRPSEKSCAIYFSGHSFETTIIFLSASLALIIIFPSLVALL